MIIYNLYYINKSVQAHTFKKMGFISVMNHILFRTDFLYTSICHRLRRKYTVNVNGYSIVRNGYMLKTVLCEKISDSFGARWGRELSDIIFHTEVF